MSLFVRRPAESFPQEGEGRRSSFVARRAFAHEIMNEHGLFRLHSRLMVLRERAPLAATCAAVILTAASCIALKAPAAADDAADGGPSSDAALPDGGSPFRVVHAAPQGPTLYGIWVASPTFAVAVGEGLTSFVIRDGAMLRLGGSWLGRDYQGISGIAEDDIFAVGKTASSTGFVAHFDGVKWTTVFDAPVPLFGVWATKSSGKTVVMACGGSGKVYGWFTGSSWREVLSLPKGPNDPDLAASPRLWAITGRNLDDFTIVADGRVWRSELDEIAFYDEDVGAPGLQFRGAWQSPDPPTSVYFGTNFSGLTWFSATHTGEQAPMSALHLDESIPAADKTFLHGVWGVPEKVVAVGHAGRVFSLRSGNGRRHLRPSADRRDAHVGLRELRRGRLDRR